jgi:hypothetical protein
MTDPTRALMGGPETPPVNETGSQWIRRLYRPGVRELGLRILAQEIAKRPRLSPGDPIPDADIFALASRCEAAGNRADAACDALEVAELAKPRAKAAVDEALRLQGIALDEFRDVALPLIWARATTPSGLLAKVRALKFVFPADDDSMVAKLEEALKVEGVFEPEATLFSLVRDVLTLAGKSEAAAA